VRLYDVGEVLVLYNFNESVS